MSKCHKSIQYYTKGKFRGFGLYLYVYLSSCSLFLQTFSAFQPVFQILSVFKKPGTLFLQNEFLGGGVVPHHLNSLSNLGLGVV